MEKGNINIQAENIFPIIKKFLYTDQEIFIRELISNAVDATSKLKKLASIGEFKGDLGDLKIEVSIDKTAKTISIKDRGIGMTSQEVKKYINQVAFSGAEEFVKKYKEDDKNSGIIGHFGLGFYSSFMVAKTVQIKTKSYKKSKGCLWECDGSPKFSLNDVEKKDRGTEVILFVSDDATEFLEDSKISSLLNKYCKFLPVEIKFGTNKKTEKNKKGKEVEVEEDNIINNTNPLWKKSPSKLKAEDYASFYREVYPYNFDQPLFHIHLNVDFPFNLTGVLYFPKISPSVDLNKNKIQLYCNQVFVTDSVEGVVPDFLGLLHGIIDSPDIPLNVSRSALQSDSNVKKISSHISKKVSDKLKKMFKDDRKNFESKWNDMKLIVEYGMLSDDKFYERASDFCLYPNVDGDFFTMKEFSDKIKDSQKDKEGKLIYLYASDKNAQHSYIAEAKERGFEVLLLDSPIISHLIQKFESKMEKSSFVRVDSDSIDKLVQQEVTVDSILSDKEKDKLKPLIEEALPKEGFTVVFENLPPSSSPFSITISEFMRRMKEMSMTGGGGMMGMQNMPDSYNLVINTNHKLISKILKTKGVGKKKLIQNAINLALLSKNLLKGEALTNYINNSFDNLKK
tara:strand:+ start:1449 stop:3320 length:1872 start_codon:yes stop_codon:yes gene_type:complete